MFMETFIFDPSYTYLVDVEQAVEYANNILPFSEFLNLNTAKNVSELNYLRGPFNVLSRNYLGYLNDIKLSTVIEHQMKFEELTELFFKRLAGNVQHSNVIDRLGSDNAFGCLLTAALGNHTLVYSHEVIQHTDFLSLSLSIDQVLLIDNATRSFIGSAATGRIMDGNVRIDLTEEFNGFVEKNKLSIGQTLHLFEFNIRLAEYS